MSAYLLGRGLKEHEFSCTRTITLRMERLARIDREMLALVDRGTFGYKASKHGFPVLYSIPLLPMVPLTARPITTKQSSVLQHTL